MNKSSLSLCLCLALLFTSSLGELTFTDAIASTTGEYTITTKTQGKTLTLSTTKGFSWVISDTMTTMENAYVTLLCLSSGSVVGFGGATHASGYPGSFERSSQIVPITGSNFLNQYVDLLSLYYPSKPAVGKSVALNYFGIDPVLGSGDKIIFQYDSSNYFFNGDKYVSSYNPRSGGGGANLNAVGFEILNCGTAIFCIQTLAQFQASPGVCESSETATCTAPTCATVTNQADCSTASPLIVEDLYCLSQCPTSTSPTSVNSATTVTSTLSVCTTTSCTSPCKECSGTATTCTSCIDGYLLDSGASTCSQCTAPCSACSGTVTFCTACQANYYLHQNTCVNPCPDGYEGDDSSGECKKIAVTVQSSSSGFATWKLAVIIGVPAVVILAGIIIFAHFKFAATAKGNAYAVKETPPPQGFNQLATSPSHVGASPTTQGTEV